MRWPWKSDKNKKPAQPNPEIKAEQLLAKILTEDEYFSFAALGWFEVDGRIHKTYRLHRREKTRIIDWKDRHFSACIYATETVPDADRIAAEYLLIRHEERQYLKTANLTEIQPHVPLTTFANPILHMGDRLPYADAGYGILCAYATTGATPTAALGSGCVMAGLVAG